MSPSGDPRPLTSEPLSLDLVNTVWVENGERRDLLSEEGGLRLWLAAHGFDVPANGRVRAALLEAREAMRAFLVEPTDPAARAQLDAVLARGAERTRLGRSGVEREVDVAATRRASWLAAVELVRLHQERPERIRPCGNPDCVLWFLDVSRPGTRRWCSMAGCGNREKARRHYAPTSA